MPILEPQAYIIANEIDMGFNLESVQEYVDVDHWAQLGQIPFSLDQHHTMPQSQYIDDGQQPKKKRQAKRCTTCGHDKHPNGSKRGGTGDCNIPVAERIQYKRSMGSKR